MLELFAFSDNRPRKDADDARTALAVKFGHQRDGNASRHPEITGRHAVSPLADRDEEQITFPLHGRSGGQHLRQVPHIPFPDAFGKETAPLQDGCSIPEHKRGIFRPRKATVNSYKYRFSSEMRGFEEVSPLPEGRA